MLKAFFVSACAGIALLMAGCSSVEVSENFSGLDVSIPRSQPVAQVHGYIYGVYLFNKYPLFSGSYNNPGKAMAFKDTATLERTMLMTLRVARGRNTSKIINLHTTFEDSWLWWSLLFWSREWQVSGTAIR